MATHRVSCEPAHAADPNPQPQLRESVANVATEVIRGLLLQRMKTDAKHVVELVEMRLQRGLFWHQQAIRVKNSPVLCRKDFMLQHEWCFYGWREGAGHEFFGPNNVRDAWQVDKVPQQNMVHLTEKPVELAVRAMQYSSRAGENVLDLFGGSGSTLIAAEQTGRRAFLMELDPPYCDVIVQRWEKFTTTGSSSQ